MTKISRRQVMFGIAASPLVAIPLSSFSTTQLNPNPKLIKAMRNEEFSEVNRLWLQQHRMSPKAYLRSRLANNGRSHPLNASTIKRLSQEDFKNNLIMDVHGFQLSLFEAALIASMGTS